MVMNGRAVIDARLKDLRVVRSPLLSPPRVDEPHEGRKVTASIHSEDHARVRAPVPTADSAAPVPVPGERVVAGTAVLPHPSYARTRRVGRCLTPWCLSSRAGVQTAEAPRQEGHLKEQAF